MDWLTSLRGAIEYMEEHLLEPVTPEDIGKAVNISPFYLQKGFQIMTGYGLGEYIRCRRLYMAAMDLLAGDEKVIEIAYKYCYQTPESFAKAFSRFHGFPPSQVKRQRRRIKIFLPLKITITIQGGHNVDYKIEKMDSFKVIGFEEDIPMERGYELCPKMWDRLTKKYFSALWQGKTPETDLERAIVENGVGAFGVCVEGGGDTFAYMVGGAYKGGPVPEGMKVREIPAAAWAKFCSAGPMPEGMHSLYTQIFQEWLPGNREYDLAHPIDIEYYECIGDGMDYEIWLPVTEKEKG
ncbi:AraC family transcriptional regulator [Acutalibacter muris]|uniref:AraC family transcriptional regulator n=1 Tax=Acutalibacter muris TaxID=1796620 RepID=UPI001C3E9BD1|nr:AraC family transcriptional regulator [Acutalibacter muris]